MRWKLATLITSGYVSEVLQDKNIVWTYQHVVEGPLEFDRLWVAFDAVDRSAHPLPLRYRDYVGHRLWAHRHTGSEHAFGGQNLFWHPHPWPLAIAALGPGRYDLHLGGCEHQDQYSLASPPPSTFRVSIEAPTIYEMTDRGLWHAISLGGLAYSVMISGPSWDTWTPEEEDGGAPDMEEANVLGLRNDVETALDRIRGVAD